MIVKMQKVFAVSRRSDRDHLLNSLGELGVVHLQPVNPDKAVAAATTLSEIDRLGRAIQILSAIEPEGDRPDIPAVEAAEQTMDIQRSFAEGRTRLAEIHHQVEQIEIWGDLRLEQIRKLEDRDINLLFYSVLTEQAAQIRAELVHEFHSLPKDRVLVAVVVRGGDQPELPDDALAVELPPTDRPALLAQAKQLEQNQDTYAKELASLAWLANDLSDMRSELQRQAEFTIARQSGLVDEALFAIQGWVPADEAGRLGGDLAAAGVEAAVQFLPPAEDENPPTLIRYPRWARPIQAMFDMLGTVPGFHEFDVSGFFMISMPIFVAMLIGDAGYGLLFLLLPLVFYRKMVAKAGKPATVLIMIFGITTVLWGVITANYFGVTPDTVAEIAGFVQMQDGEAQADVGAMARSDAGGWAAIGRAMLKTAPLYRINPEEGRNLIIKISFILGCIHLVFAQLRQALGKIPDIRFLSNIGWSIILPGMLGVIWQMFFIGIDQPWPAWIPTLIVAGSTLVVLFSHPSRNPLKMIGLGVLTNIMPMINTFSDTMSYIRLMAVGLASYYIAYSFNLLGGQIADGSHWIVAIPVILFGHGLNIGLGILAVLAHGVRLNMLEFSSNAGVQWSGYAYRPFAKKPIKEPIKEN